MNYETCKEIEVAVADHFGCRTHVIVPNLSWGMFAYEMDLCVFNQRTMYAYEVEIKISRSDLLRDSKKWHNHDRNGNYIQKLYFAFPVKLRGKVEELVPENTGIMFVTATGKVMTDRQPVVNRIAKTWDYKKMYELGRLGTLRLWSYKRLERERMVQDAHRKENK